MKLVKNTQRLFLAMVAILAVTQVGCCQDAIEVQHFRSEVQGNTIVFNWSLSTESQNVKAFGLERAGADLQFETIGTVAVRPTHSSSSTFHFTDQHPMNGAAFYRLKVMDTAGNVHYCKVISQAATAATQTGR